MKNSLLFIFVLLIVGCKNQNDSFNIFYPEVDVTIVSLKENKFSRVVLDEVMYSKMYGDTVLSYQFLQDITDNSKPWGRFCEFPIKDINQDSLELFFHNRNCFVVSEIRKHSAYKSFFIRNQSNNLLFECSIDSLKSTMSLYYGYPQFD